MLVAVWLIVQPGVVKQIGSWKITKSDLAFRTEVAKIYFPDADEKAALMQLEKSARYLEILEKNGITVTEADLDAEEKRIRKQTQDPKILDQIAKVFKGDEKAYRKNFVLPNLVNHFIYFEFFLNNPKIQNVVYEKALNLIKSVEEDKSVGFEQHAEKQGYKVITIVLDKSGVQSPPSEVIDLSDKKNSALFLKIKRDMQKKSGSQGLKFWRDQVLPKFQNTQTLPRPIDQENRLLVVHLKERKSDKEAIFQVVSIDKLKFDDWLATQ